MTLKDCLYQSLHRSEKPLKLIAEEIGMSENYLYRSALPDPEESENGTGCRFPLKKLIPLIRCTGDYSLLDFIESSLGRVAVPLPVAQLDLPDVYRLTMLAVKEFGDLMSQIEKAVSDGNITEKEKGRIIEAGHEAVQAIINLLHQLEAEA